MDRREDGTVQPRLRRRVSLTDQRWPASRRPGARRPSPQGRGRALASAGRRHRVLAVAAV